MSIAALAGLALFLKVFPGFIQDNRFWLALLLPVQVALAFVLRERHTAHERPAR